MSESTIKFHLSIKDGDQTIVKSTVGAIGTSESVSRAKKTIRKLLDDFTPVMEVKMTSPDLQQKKRQ